MFQLNYVQTFLLYPFVRRSLKGSRQNIPSKSLKEQLNQSDSQPWPDLPRDRPSRLRSKTFSNLCQIEHSSSNMIQNESKAERKTKNIEKQLQKSLSKWLPLDFPLPSSPPLADLPEWWTVPANHLTCSLESPHHERNCPNKLSTFNTLRTYIKPFGGHVE